MSGDGQSLPQSGKGSRRPTRCRQGHASHIPRLAEEGALNSPELKQQMEDLKKQLQSEECQQQMKILQGQLKNGDFKKEMETANQALKDALEQLKNTPIK